MILKSIKLENIRSYLNEEIKFTEGSTLLSGDIGSGKSTILLAIEFAFFGLKNPELRGNSLLRNGQNNGFIELKFSIGNKDIFLKRSLKRSKDSITQDSGEIIIDNESLKLSAIELRQKVLELFNYPKELLTKSKDLVYKYTIYTPQEEMKQILLGNKDNRLDTLRKVFGIDKYKRISENLNMYSKFLRSKKNMMNIRIEDYLIKLDELKTKQDELKTKQEKINNLDKEIVLLNEKINDINVSLKDIEDKIRLLNDLKTELRINNSNLGHYVNDREKNTNRMQELKTFLEKNKLEEISNLDELKNNLQKKEIEKLEIENKIKDVNYKTQELQINITNSSKIKTNINELDYCPVCKQQVSIDHKHKIQETENIKVKDSTDLLDKNKEILKLEEEKLQKISLEIEILRKEEREAMLKKIKVNSINEKKNEYEKLLLEQDELKKKIGESNIRKIELENKIKLYSNLEEIFNERKKELDIVNTGLRNLEIEKAELNQNIRTLNENIESLEKEIKIKENIKKEIEKISNLQLFLESEFSQLIESMERSIMLKVHDDFDSMFQKWFSILVDNEQLQISLDYEFTPVIIQNGHKIDYFNLSGGEKTAAALAYRLALNQTINKLMSKIKTNDIIILDEPTDGFSSEQVDRMRNIFDELNLKQLIIVSHDDKIESFVDNVIKLTKRDHVSKILN